MHVFFDEQIFVEQEQGGISRYFAELARALGETNMPVHLFAGITRNRYVPPLRPAQGVTVRYWPRRDQLRINTWIARLSRIARRWEFARLRRQSAHWVYHATNYAVDPWIARRATVTVLTVFDMIAEQLCDESTRSRSLEAKRRGLALARRVLCISEQTQRDFLHWFPERRSAARVTHLAASLRSPSTRAAAAAGAHAPFLLLVGKRSGYKNGRSAVAAFAHLAQSNPAVRLVCFGGEPLSVEEQSLLDAGGLRPRCVAVQGDDDLLAGYYASAAALLYPSRYEGFGLPVLEAMQLGCPVVTTRCGSLPEVGGDAVIYVEPDDVPGLAQAAVRLLADPAWRQTWADAGRIQSRRFSWTLTAARTREAYEELFRSSSAGISPLPHACCGLNQPP